MPRTACSTAGSDSWSSSQTRAALAAARLACACSTPDTSPSAFSTLLTQAAQCMPETGMVMRSLASTDIVVPALRGSVHCPPGDVPAAEQNGLDAEVGNIRLQMTPWSMEALKRGDVPARHPPHDEIHGKRPPRTPPRSGRHNAPAGLDVPKHVL